MAYLVSLSVFWYIYQINQKRKQYFNSRYRNHDWSNLTHNNHPIKSSVISDKDSSLYLCILILTMGVRFQDIRIWICLLSGYTLHVWYWYALCSGGAPESARYPDTQLLYQLLQCCTNSRCQYFYLDIRFRGTKVPKHQSTKAKQRCVNDTVSYFIINMHPWILTFISRLYLSHQDKIQSNQITLTLTAVSYIW